MVWLDPLPLEEDIHKAYQMYYTHTSALTSTGARGRIRDAVRSGYLRGALGYTTGIGAPWHRYVRFLAYLYPTGSASIRSEAMFLTAPRFPARLLDVGCGNGDLLVGMRSLGWDVEGVEVDRTAVQTARARGLAVREGDLKSQRYPSESFGAVVMSHVIEHVYDPPGLLREAHRILEPGGTLVLLTPNSQSLGTRLYGQDWRGWEPPRHLHIFNLDNMRTTLEQSGFTEARVTASARAARDILPSSAALRQTRMAGGHTVGPDTSQNALARVALQFSARLLAVVSRRTGEEILAIARKIPRS